jgi:hypothetical protein
LNFPERHGREIGDHPQDFDPSRDDSNAGHKRHGRNSLDDVAQEWRWTVPMSPQSILLVHVRKGVCINHGARRYCIVIDCGKALFQTGKCSQHFRCSLAAPTIDTRHIGLHATIMDITNLTLEFIQQYVGMNNWENVIAFAGVCKSWKMSTKTFCLKIGV